MPAGWRSRVWADGLGGQEDELEDVAEGKLEPPTDTEGEGSIDNRNVPERGDDDVLVERIERGDREAEDEDELARKAGVKLPN